MRYANIEFEGKSQCNIGDNLQLLSIDHLYDILRIPREDIVRISYTNLKTWKSLDGRKVLLPINFPFLEYTDRGIAGLFSDDIIPLFLGFTYIKPFLDKEEIEYFKKYEPIGCRDEYTYNTMQKYGIQSWINGCMTLTLFEKRKKTEQQSKVFLVDIIEKIEKRIPQAILDNAIRCTQLVQKEKINGNINSYVNDRMKVYMDNAKLVITSRLHCAVPCIAMGIPTILIVPKVSFRFSWLERIIPIYTTEDMNSVNWKPHVIDCEEIKKKMIANAITYLQACSYGERKISEGAKTLSDYYLDRDKHNYYVEGYDNGVKYLQNKYKHDDEFNYAVWGVTYIAEMIYQFVRTTFPNAKLVGAFDANKELDFHGLKTKKIENADSLSNAEIFVTAFAATGVAKVFFESNEQIKMYCLCYENEI